MFCGHCGAKNQETDRFCGICGIKLPEKEPEIVYVEEKPMESILNNNTVIALTLFIFVLSMITIIGVSIITKSIPESDQLKGIHTVELY